MIKFFRQIRFKLMNENKTSKYFKYAIGEIILVVIGILIALQINNWNENNKLKVQETEIISSLVEELKNNNRFLKASIAANSYINRSSLKLLDSIKLGYTSFERRSVLITTAHNPRVFHFPVMEGILSKENQLVTQKNKIIPQLRVMKVLHENIEKNLYYLDENWNFHLSKFSINCGFDYSVDIKNKELIRLKKLEKCDYPKEKLKGIISLTCELRTSWIESMETAMKQSESLLKKLDSLK